MGGEAEASGHEEDEYEDICGWERVLLARGMHPNAAPSPMCSEPLTPPPLPLSENAIGLLRAPDSAASAATAAAAATQGTLQQQSLKRRRLGGM